MMIITFLALVTTIYFSQQSLDKTASQVEQGKEQLKQANQQLKLAQDQFKEGINQRRIDSVRAEEEEDLQNERFNIQNNINKKNLNAIELQAKIAKSQFDAQARTTAELLYQNRPIFILQETSFDSLQNLAYISIRNIGKRPARIIRSKLFAYDNSIYKTVRFNYVEKDNVEMNENSISRFRLSMYKGEFTGNQTLYYIHFVYEDVMDGKNKHFQKFFIWKKLDNGATEWSQLNPEVQLFLKKQILARKLNLDLKTN